MSSFGPDPFDTDDEEESSQTLGPSFPNEGDKNPPYEGPKTTSSTPTREIETIPAKRIRPAIKIKDKDPFVEPGAPVVIGIKNKSTMETVKEYLEEYKGPLIGGGVGVGLGFLSKSFLRKEILPVSGL